ncbi:glutathione S-transferase N-terminal domain-containing protein [Pantoea sp. DY-17]|nr:glutathione S-transferase N-terminal domain-containing protein [Pantoea sp. DY-17]
MKLYIYEHCPFCVRARMIFGIKKIPFELRVMSEADAETPTSMVGKKIAPILEKDDGTFMAGSRDIVHYVDGQCGGRFLKGTGNASSVNSRLSWSTGKKSMNRTSGFIPYCARSRLSMTSDSVQRRASILISCLP